MQKLLCRIAQSQVVLRYRKLVVTNESIPFLRSVGVCLHAPDEGMSMHAAVTTASIVPGMEFMDDG